MPSAAVPAVRHPLDATLVVAIFIVASCGLAYELIAAALASYLLGDSVLQFSTIIGGYLFAMGVGAHLSRYVREEQCLARFIEIELLVGLIGGVSAALLFVVYAWLGAPFRSTLYALVLVIGILVGMEIPLVMRVLNQRQAEFRDLVSRVLTFDYLGALAVSLLFPLVLAPKLGLTRSALLFGLLNAGVGWWSARRFASDLAAPRALQRRALICLLLLALGFAGAGRLTEWAEQHQLGDPIIHAETTPFQRIVITRWHDDLRLHINGNLQFSTRDEHRYHEALVHPALAALPGARRVLVLGGGDGLALREILKYPQIEQAVLVDLDPAMPRLFSATPELAALNGNAFADPRVRVIEADAARWLEESTEPAFDLIVADFPDPTSFALGKLYSVPIYAAMRRLLGAHGLLVVQSTSPYYAPNAYWCVDATLRAAGLRTWPYHAYVPSFGEWGFILAGTGADYRPPARIPVPTRFLDAGNIGELFRFPPDMAPRALEPNHLNNQVLVHHYQQDWAGVIR